MASFYIILIDTYDRTLPTGYGEGDGMVPSSLSDRMGLRR